jgi:hypothetical protein
MLRFAAAAAFSSSTVWLAGAALAAPVADRVCLSLLFIIFFLILSLQPNIPQ